MIIYRLIADYWGTSLDSWSLPTIGEVCLMKQNTWSRINYTKEDYVIGLIKRK